MIHYKSHQTAQQKVTPSESDLEIIRSFALAGEPIDPEDLFIGRMSLANDQYDRSHERFPESYLAQFAATIPGKSVMTGHDYSRDPAGRIYKAEVASHMATATERGIKLGKELVVSYYLLKSDPLAAKVKAGIARDVSIGFVPDIRVCDVDGKNYDGWMLGEEDPCPHVAGKGYGETLARVTYGGDVTKAEGNEASFVWLGCQYGAQAIASMRAFAPEAKSAYFDSRGGKGVWQIPFDEERHLFTLHGPPPVHPTAQKEANMLVEQKGAPPPGEPKFSPADERLLNLGKAYIAAMQAHVKSRYGPCGQEKTGEVIAGLFETASPEEITAAVKAADEVFNEHFPGVGKGVPASDTPINSPKRKFNPWGMSLPRSG